MEQKIIDLIKQAKHPRLISFSISYDFTYPTYVRATIKGLNGKTFYNYGVEGTRDLKAVSKALSEILEELKQDENSVEEDIL